MPRLLVLRHAQSTWNAAGLLQGWSDAPLSEHGVDQARRAGRALSVMGVTPGLVASSDLSRAEETARLLAGETGYKRDIFVVEKLREQDLGEWNGLTRSEIEVSWPGALTQRDRGRLLDVPGGESGRSFTERSLAALTLVGARCLAARAEQAIAVSHGGVLVVLEQALGLAEQGLKHPNLSGWWLELSGSPEVPAMAATERVELLEVDVEIGSRPA